MKQLIAEKKFLHKKFTKIPQIVHILFLQTRMLSTKSIASSKKMSIFFFIFIFLLLFMSGDIELNPGTNETKFLFAIFLAGH